MIPHNYQQALESAIEKRLKWTSLEEVEGHESKKLTRKFLTCANPLFDYSSEPNHKRLIFNMYLIDLNSESQLFSK